jgi:putative nucleotidyltransferase with HDIG domain
MKDSLDRYLDTIDHLPPAPTVVVKLIALFRQPDRDLDEVVAVMRLDPSLTAEVLRRSNSAAHGSGETVVDVFDAIMRVGFYEVYQTAVAWFGQHAISLRGNTPGLKTDVLWRHSALTAVAAGKVSEKIGESSWTGFTGGLLHDIGKIALASAEGAKYASLTAQAGASGNVLEQGEKDAFGYGHSEVGARLLHRWGVPPEISMPIYFHHQSEWPEQFERSCATVNLANRIAHDLELSEAERSQDWESAAAVIAKLGLSHDDIAEISKKTQTEMSSLGDMFTCA